MAKSKRNSVGGWVIARVPSNTEFKLHRDISRPVTGYDWDDNGKRVEIRGKGPACYTPAAEKLVQKNQWNRIQRKERTVRPFPLLPSYIFIRNPPHDMIAELIERKRIYGLIPDVPRASNNYEPGPLLLTDRAINHMRARYGCEYDPDTGAGHQTTMDPKAHMQPGYEYDAGDYVVSDDPAWMGHRLLCVEVMDTRARVICKMFGIDHSVDVPLGELRKAS